VASRLHGAVLDGLGGEVCELFARAPRLRFDAGTWAGPETFRDFALLVVEEGVVALRASIPDGTRGVIACHAGRGAILLPPTGDETFRIVEDVSLIGVDHATRGELLAEPVAAAAIVAALEETLRQKTETIIALSSFHHVERVRKKLVQLARDYGRVGRDGVRLELPLTHDLLSEMTGSARETVTRALDELQREGFVRRRGREYVLDASVTALTSPPRG
jgi:CRP/FNR family transcriptional regulator